MTVMLMLVGIMGEIDGQGVDSDEALTLTLRLRSSSSCKYEWGDGFESDKVDDVMVMTRVMIMRRVVVMLRMIAS